MISIVEYDKSLFPFVACLRQHYDWGYALGALHNWSSEEFPLLEGKDKDQSSPIHKHFYSIFDTDNEFLAVYYQFVSKVVRPFYGEDIVYQAKPTFRIHYPDNLAVGEWHKDSEYNHPLEEENWWVPFTLAYDTNTIWLESEEDKGDYKAYDLSPGQCLLFPGGKLRHGNKVNETGVSRVSIDFRVMRMRDYKASDAGSAAMKLKFQVGGYYAALEVKA